MPTAGAVIIGDEILSGKIADTNTATLIRFLADAGVRLRRVSIVGDNADDIGAAVRDCAARYDHVFCSGGVGPTHDDRTIEAVARAFGRAVIRHPGLAALLREYLGEHLTEAALKMANVVEGTRLIEMGRFPAFAFENVYILPGVPQLFAAKLEALRSELRGTRPVVHRVFVEAFESAIADALERVERELAPVKVGSYPRMDVTDHKVMVTIEEDDRDLVDRALARLLALLPAAVVVRVERG